MLLSSVVLASTIQQSYSAKHIYIYPFILVSSPQVTTEYSLEFPELYSSFLLVTYFIHGINRVYMSVPIS